MAVPSTMQITPDLKPVAGLPGLTTDAVAETSRLMQRNHDNHHVFFNTFGFHDHIAHQMLTMYANGATVAQLKAQYDRNSQYQRPVAAGEKQPDSNSIDVSTPDGFIKGFGRHEKYGDYLSLFTNDIQARGLSATLDEYVFGDDERAKGIFSRLNASIIHPMIHFGLSIEFNLPSMTAEALAWAAMHTDELRAFNKAVTAASTGPDPGASLMDLYDQLGKYRDAAKKVLPFAQFGADRYDKIIAIDDGVIIKIVSQYRVTEANLQHRILEAINVQAFVALAAQQRPYVPKVDFFNVHGHNGTVYLPALVDLLGPKKAARIVEHQLRACLVDYLTIGGPSFDMDWTREFVKDPSKQPGGGVYSSWLELFAKANTLNDDGHIVKALRALKGVEQAAGKQSQFSEPLKGDEALGLAGVLLRSTEHEPDFVIKKGPTNQWIRKAGFAEAWEAQHIQKID